MDAIIEKGTKVGRADRQREQWQKRYQKDFVTVEPETDLENAITETNELINRYIASDRRMDVDESFQRYMNLRSWRHDIWIELLNKAKTTPLIDYGDVKVEDFCNALDRDLGITVDKPPDAIKKKTPDILVYVQDQGTVYVGDVAVAASVEIRDQTKREKYAPIVRWFQSQGFRSVVVNLIIDHELRNRDTEIKQLEDYRLIEVSPRAKLRASHFHTICHMDMERVVRLSDSPSNVWAQIQAYDRNKPPDAIDLPKVNRKVAEVKTKVPESTIIDWVKNETEDRLKMSYYDKGVEKSISEFDKILSRSNENKEVKPPKSTLMACDNSYSHEEKTSHDLVMDYIRDIAISNVDDVKQYVLDMLPDKSQLVKMKETYKKDRKVKDIEKKVFGPFQYSRTSKTNNRLTSDLNRKLLMGKKIRNEKVEPHILDKNSYNDFFGFIEQNITKFGAKSLKKPFLDDSWEASNKFEYENTASAKQAYDYVRSTVGAQLAHSFGNLYQRITHLKTSESSRDNFYVPPNGAFVAVIPKEHAPITSSTCDMPCIFICRYPKEHLNEVTCEYEHTFNTDKYKYYVSKLCRFNIDKIANWDQAGHSVVVTSTYLLMNNPELMQSKERVVGIMTYLVLDIHQKTSEYLDLLKYISFMPFSQVHRLSHLVKDKMDLLKKTRLDIWMIMTMRSFVKELSLVDKINAKKPIIGLCNGKITRESLGMTMKLPSFIDLRIRHSSVQQFIEEVNTLFISRPKQLYGSQFMDRSIHNTAEWNHEFEQEYEDYGDWVITGEPNDCNPTYPFNAKFAFCKDAIIYAQEHFLDQVPVDCDKVEKELSKEKYVDYMHTSCSLRGCTKSKDRRKNRSDIHTTSMEECLYEYEVNDYKEEESTIIATAIRFMESGEPMQFSMSEKNQRGSGRPIATPTLGAKAALSMIEKPESAIGKCVGNNIIVSRKNKLQAMSEAYKSLVAEAAISGYTKIYQLTEDQSKFSENDNIRKYYPYVNNNRLLKAEVRSLQLKALDSMANREHLVKRMPKQISEDKDLKKYINEDRNGIVATIGWPQGMLNFISTSVHSIADYWITYAYNMAYPSNKVMTRGLVHSDDSWAVVACESEEDFIRFSVFRAVAKKLFCLKLNDKKLWGSKYLGELVSNYNINGNVHLSVTKAVTNSFNTLMYQNWVIDVNSQISSLQQAYRNGASLDILILMYTVLKQQMIKSYKVTGKQNELLHLLPIELGGYPDKPVFSIAVTGSHSHYQQLMTIYMSQENKEQDYVKIVTKAMTLSALGNKGIAIDKSGRFYNTEEGSKKYLRSLMEVDNDEGVIAYYREEDEEEEYEEVAIDDRGEDEEMDARIVRRVVKIKKRAINDDDYANLVVIGRGDVFTCVKHLMPKSKKMTATIDRLSRIPFEGDGLGMISTTKRSFKETLGNLKDQTSTMLYQLASEHYSQSARRLAISQAIQSSGKTVRIGELKPMTINSMLEFLETCMILPNDVSNIKAAFYDDSSVSDICWNIVMYSEHDQVQADKRKIINSMPKTENRYKTTSRLDEVLLSIVDDALHTDYYVRYTRQQATFESLRDDKEAILKRFDSYFGYYDVKYAVCLIMTEYMKTVKSKLWMQPYLRTEDSETFLCDLYGKTVSRNFNYKVRMIYTLGMKETIDSKIVNTLYTMQMLNNIYKDQFHVETIDGMTQMEALRAIDPIDLTESDRMKMAVVHYKLTDDTYKIREIEENMMYRQKYIVSQKYENGRYRGYFKVYVQYSSTVLCIEGEPMFLTLTSNNHDTHNITKAMMEFTQRNFIMYKYEHPSQWASSDLWYTSNPIKSNLYLNYHCSSTSNIGTRPSGTSLPLKINDKMIFPGVVPTSHYHEYTVDQSLRVVKKIVDEEEFRVFSINQDFSCPMIDKVILEPAFVDGFLNQDLIKNKVIINLCTKRYYNTPTHFYRELLEKKPSPICPTALLDFYCKLIENVDPGMAQVEQEDLTVEYETIEIMPAMPSDIMSMIETIEPEDIKSIQVTEIYDDLTEVAPKINATRNITRLMCSIIYGHKTDEDIEDFISNFMTNREIRIKLLQHKSSTAEEFNEEIEEWRDATYMIPDSVRWELRCFIMGNDMDKMSRYYSIDVRSAMNRRPRPNISPVITLYSENAITDFMYTYLELDREDMYTELRI